MLQAELELVGAFSPFFADLIEKEAELAEQALHDMDSQFDQPVLEKRYLGFLEEDAPGELAARPRRLRSQKMIRIIFCDLTRRADLLETTAELSHLADFYKRKNACTSYAGFSAGCACCRGNRPETRCRGYCRH